MYKRRADDFETAENKDTKPGFKRVFADISSKEKGKIPIPFSAPVDKADQSLDLHTIFLMNKEDIIGSKIIFD